MLRHARRNTCYTNQSGTCMSLCVLSIRESNNHVTYCINQSVRFICHSLPKTSYSGGQSHLMVQFGMLLLGFEDVEFHTRFLRLLVVEKCMCGTQLGNQLASLLLTLEHHRLNSSTAHQLLQHDRSQLTFQRLRL